jgi:hypothetical protein
MNGHGEAISNIHATGLEMKFLFVCPLRQETFSSANFEIIDNRGVAVNADGSRYLNARIRLTTPCPACGKQHEYHANELACPFSASH